VKTLADAVLAAFLALAFYTFVMSKQLYSWYPLPLVGLAAPLGGRRGLLLAIAVSLPVAMVAVVEPAIVNHALGWRYFASGYAVVAALGSLLAVVVVLARTRRPRAAA
jgi:hypothetical protein